jgi:hypothetical protein
MGMGVTDGYHGMTAIEVQVLLTFVVPYLTAFALHDIYVEEWVYVE